MNAAFRFLLVEDICLDAAMEWVRGNLPGTKDQNVCCVDACDSLAEAYDKILEYEYDGLILDMDLHVRPAGTQGLYPDLPVDEEIFRANQYRNATGGLWLWAHAARTRTDRPLPP